MVSKTVVCLNDEPVEDYKAVEIEECGLIREEVSESKASKELWSV